MCSKDYYVSTIPDKTPSESVDFLRILEEFDPSGLSPEAMEEFSKRNPLETDYWSKDDGTPLEPVDNRLAMAQFEYEAYREELKKNVSDYVKAVQYKPPIDKCYMNAKTALIKAIDSKAALYMVQQEYNSMTEEQRKDQARQYEAWVEQCNAELKLELQEMAAFGDECIPIPDTAEKIKKIREGVCDRHGKCFSQWEFAKLIEYPEDKYAAAESGKEIPEYLLLEKLVMICHANPYWLLDDKCAEFFAEYDPNKFGESTIPVFVNYDVILQWILDGKPTEVNLDDYWDTDD